MHDQVVSLNSQLLSDKYSASFEQQLGAIAAGTKVVIEIKPARERTPLKSKSVLKFNPYPYPYPNPKPKP